MMSHAILLSALCSVVALLSAIEGLYAAPPEQRETAPTWPDNGTGEPFGLESVRIDEARIELDLRQEHAASVTVVYLLRNTGDRREVTLTFGDSEWFPYAFPRTVLLDDEEVPCFEVDEGTIRIAWSWVAVRSTPALDGGGELPYEPWQGKVSECRFTLAPGAHRLEIHSYVDPTRHQHGATVIEQFAYNLSPARGRRSMGPVDVTVLLPAVRQWASNPKLSRDGNVLRGSFKGPLPAAITLSYLRVPLEPISYVFSDLAPIFWFLSVIIAAFTTVWIFTRPH